MTLCWPHPAKDTSPCPQTTVSPALRLALLPVCPAVSPAGVGTFPARRGATPGVQKAQHAGDHQQTRLRGGRLFPDPSPSQIGSSRRLQTERRLQHGKNRTWPSAAAPAVGHSCSEDAKTQGSAPAPAEVCAQPALPRSISSP